jgi:prepilin peptidase CpaA
MQLLDGLLIILLSICLFTDIKSRKIYNNVLLPVLFLALILQVFLHGWIGLFSSFLGLIVGFAILLIPYMMKGMGAGDVKLMAVIGAIQGPLFILTTAVYMAVIGGVVASLLILYRLIKSKQWISLFHHTSLMTYGMKLAVIRSHSSNQTFPYGVAIVGGACCTMLFQGVIRL